MTPDELEEIPAAIERLFYDQQARVMEDVVRRIHKTGRITSTADYQIGKMVQQGKSTEWIESEIKRLGNLTDAEVRSLYDKVIQADYVRKRGLYEQVNAKYTPYEDNKVMQKWVHALIDQTQGELKNISRSMGFSVSMENGKKSFTPLADYYQRYIDRACMDIMTGAFDYNTVLRRVAKEMADSGLEYVSYASGHVDRATVAARRAVMTGVNQLSGQINMRLADELGTNYFEVSWHSGARPEHWWGGQVFSKEDLVDVCEYGEPTGLLGPNCRHSFMPFVPGVSTRTYTDEQLEEMNARERETKTYNGKEYNAYSATQRQRELERRMQRQRANIVNLKKGEGSKEDIAAAQAKYLKTLYQYRDFSKQMGLSPQMERVYVDRLGRVVNNGRPKSAFSENFGAKGVENRGGNAIMTYKGIPKTWKRLEGTADDLDLKKVNPNYRWAGNDEYSRNCYNCVVAYEMRMRKYDVTAQPERKNKYLSWHPEAAWVEPDVKTVDAGEDPYQKIKDAFEEWPDGARAEIAVIWRERGFGHVFVAEKENNQLRFLDPQRNEEYTADVFKQTENEKTRFWRIDDRDVSDRGVTACKEE